MRKKPSKPTIQERVDLFAVAEQALLKKHKLAKKHIITFPKYKRPPLIGRLAGWMLKQVGGRIDTLFIETK